MSAAAARGERDLTMILAEPEAVTASETSRPWPGRLPGGSPVQGTRRLKDGIERQKWLAERQGKAARLDAEAATYDDERHPWDVQREWVARVLGLIPPGGTVLDAPCGTGTCFAMLRCGHRVAGADQSAGMLTGPGASHSPLSASSLQDLSYAARLNAVLTIEAMQHIPPEDWPGVLANLGQAVRPGGLVYLTVQVLEQRPYPAGLREPSRTRVACRGAGRLAGARSSLFPGS